VWVLNRGSLYLVSAFCSAACSSASVASNPEVASNAERLSSAPAVGPEIGTVPPVLEPSELGHNPELASDGAGFLSVQEVNERIRAVRVDDAGRVLDADWLDFGTDDGSMQLYPNAVFGGEHYLVTWSNLLTDADGINHDSIQGRFVKSDGTLEGSASVTLSSGNAIYSSVDWDGAHFVLAYMASADGGINDIHSVLINPDGSRVEASDHALTTSGSTSNPHLGVGDTNTLVVWEDYTRTAEGFDTNPRVHGTRVGRNGDVLDDAPFPLSTGVRDEQAPDVAGGSSGFLVVWQTSDMTVHGSAVTDAGEVPVKDFAIDHGTEGAGLPSVVFQDTDYAVGWTDARDGGSLYGTRVSDGAGLVGSSDTKLAPDAPREVGFGSDHTNFAFNGSHLFFSYVGAEPNGVEGSLVTETLAVALGAIPLTAIPDSQAFPSTSFDGTNYVVAWNDEERSSLDTALQAVRISGAGQLLDPAGIAVSPPDKPAFGFAIASPRDGSSLFIWSGTDNMPQQRSMAGDATLGTAGPFVTQNGAFIPGLASDGHGYLSAFDAGDSSDTGSVYGHLLGLDGASGAEFRIDASTLNTGPFVFPAPSGYLVAYARSGMHLVTVSDTGALGQVLDLTSTVAGVTGASSDTDSLIAWSEDFGSPGPLQARFVKAGAFSGDTFELTPDSLGYTPAVAWDGTSYWAVWESATHELDGRSIGKDGTLGSVLSLVPAEVYAPALISDGKGQLLLSYAKLAGERLSYRIASRLIGRGADATGGTGGTSGGSGGSAGMGAGGSSTPGSGGTNSSTGGTGSPGSGGTSTAGAGGSTTPGSGGSSSPGVGGSTGGMPAAGGTTSGSAGKSGSGGSGGRGAAGSSGTGGSGGSSPAGCSVAQGPGDRTSALGSLLGLAWAFVARRRRSRSLR
jgi:MYXO-CTERM domain-containing protein